MDEKEKRDAFNMKVLKRHDPDIIDIVGSAAFVVLYEHDEEWVSVRMASPRRAYGRADLDMSADQARNRGTDVSI